MPTAIVSFIFMGFKVRMGVGQKIVLHINGYLKYYLTLSLSLCLSLCLYII